MGEMEKEREGGERVSEKRLAGEMEKERGWGTTWAHRGERRHLEKKMCHLPGGLIWKNVEICLHSSKILKKKKL